MQIDASKLTTVNVASDGMHIRLNMHDAAGQPAALVLPTSFMQQLLMTLPSVIQRALRNKHGNDSLRLVHTLEHFRVELGEVGDDGVRRYILTLATEGGFAVSFSASAADLSSLSTAMTHDDIAHDSRIDIAKRLS